MKGHHTMPTKLFAVGDGRRHGYAPGSPQRRPREKRLAPIGDLRTSTGQRYMEILKTYLSRMATKEPGPFMRDQLVQAVLLRLKLDELEAVHLKEGRMSPQYFPLQCALEKLLRYLDVIDRDVPASPPGSKTEMREASTPPFDIAKFRAKMATPFVIDDDEDDDPEVETPTLTHEDTP
jgi:hypothetical protein